MAKNKKAQNQVEETTMNTQFEAPQTEPTEQVSPETQSQPTMETQEVKQPKVFVEMTPEVLAAIQAAGVDTEALAKKTVGAGEKKEARPLLERLEEQFENQGKEGGYRDVHKKRAKLAMERAAELVSKAKATGSKYEAETDPVKKEELHQQLVEELSHAKAEKLEADVYTAMTAWYDKNLERLAAMITEVKATGKDDTPEIQRLETEWRMAYWQVYLTYPDHAKAREAYASVVKENVRRKKRGQELLPGVPTEIDPSRLPKESKTVKGASVSQEELAAEMEKLGAVGAPVEQLEEQEQLESQE